MADRTLTIDGTAISDDGPSWVIAEIGHNHQGDLEKCKQLFREAKAAGASAVKLQKRDNRSLFTREMFNKPYDHENSFGRTYGEHREFLEFGRAEYAELQRFARELGITFFSTAFDIRVPTSWLSSTCRRTRSLRPICGISRSSLTSPGSASR